LSRQPQRDCLIVVRPSSNTASANACLQCTGLHSGPGWRASGERLGLLNPAPAPRNGLLRTIASFVGKRGGGLRTASKGLGNKFIHRLCGRAWARQGLQLAIRRPRAPAWDSWLLRALGKSGAQLDRRPWHGVASSRGSCRFALPSLGESLRTRPLADALPTAWVRAQKNRAATRKDQSSSLRKPEGTAHRWACSRGNIALCFGDGQGLLMGEALGLLRVDRKNCFDLIQKRSNLFHWLKKGAFWFVPIMQNMVSRRQIIR